jgi:hypothetical protein
MRPRSLAVFATFALLCLSAYGQQPTRNPKSNKPSAASWPPPLRRRWIRFNAPPPTWMPGTIRKRPRYSGKFCNRLPSLLPRCVAWVHR